MSTYPYQPLEGGQIRLITLFWEPENVPLSISLTATRLEDSQDGYAALSYVWGSEQKPRSLRVIDACDPLPVTESAYLALCRLRLIYAQPDKPFVVWIDAISINQDDDKEKAQQVAMMVDIYARARTVYGYLGEDADNSDELLRYLIRLHTDSLENPRIAAGMAGLFDQRFHETRVTIESVEAAEHALEASPEKRSILIAWWRLLCRPWFERIWIVQEVLVAKEVVLICGSQTFTLEQLIFFLYGQPETLAQQIALANMANPEDSLRRVSSLNSLIWTREDRKKRSSSLRLHQYLVSFPSRKTTRARDRFYALIGLASDRPALLARGFVISYSMPFEQVAQSYAVSAFKEYGLGPLCCCGIGSQPNRFPSYTSDWSDPLGWQEHWDPTVYAASSNSTPAYSLEEIGNNGLWTLSKHVDEIVWLAGKTSPTLHPMEYWAAVMYECLAPLQNYPTGQSLTEVAWRTLLCDRENGKAADSSLAWCYLAFMGIGIAALSAHNPDALRVLADLDAEVALRTMAPSVQRFGEALKKSGSNRKLCRTAKGYIGLVPARCEVGDQIHIIHGLPVPFVVRPDQTGRSITKDGIPAADFLGARGLECSVSRLVGSGYIHGIMNGEAMAWGCRTGILIII
jgi:hypothetical protein